MNRPDISRLLQFQQLLLNFSQIERRVHRKQAAAYIHENDTEHSYNLAMMAWFLAPSFPKFDVNELIKYALIHDLVEVHAGDTYAFADKAELDSKHAKELVALDKLRQEWPDFDQLTTYITEYERRETEEAKFIYALDKLMPMVMVYLADGRTWREEHQGFTVMHDCQAPKIAVSEPVNQLYDQLKALLLRRPQLFGAPMEA